MTKEAIDKLDELFQAWQKEQEDELKASRLYIAGSKEGGVDLWDPTREGGQQELHGQFFVGLPERLSSALPGSSLLPEEFLAALGVETNLKTIEELIGAPNCSGPVMNLESDLFRLRVSEGSSNPLSLAMAERAKAGWGNENRAGYQKELLELMAPIYGQESWQEKPQIIIREDCLATGETILGLLVVLNQKAGLKFENIRIEVKTATTIGLMVLIEYARENDLRLEIFTADLAYGLSAGEKIEGGFRKHANYIILPEEILGRLPADLRGQWDACRAADGNIYVVGDMGDAGKKLPSEFNKDYPWNRYRNNDRVGYRPGNTGDPLATYLADGGYPTRAFARSLGMRGSEIVLIAKRALDEKLGCGVMIAGLPESLHL